MAKETPEERKEREALEARIAKELKEAANQIKIKGGREKIARKTTWKGKGKK